MSERFGYAPKMIGGAVVGYFLGKVSYQNACAEKLMQLPNSPIGEALRKRKGRLGFQESWEFTLFSSCYLYSNYEINSYFLFDLVYSIWLN